MHVLVVDHVGGFLVLCACRGADGRPCAIPSAQDLVFMADSWCGGLGMCLCAVSRKTSGKGEWNSKELEGLERRTHRRSDWLEANPVCEP